MDKDFDFSQVPRSWALCYVSECPRKQDCLRYQVCLAAPDIKYFGKCVMPNALKQKECPMFRPIQKTQVALGFRHIFNNVLAKDVTQMRKELMNFLGSRTTFFRYQSGEKHLNPRQQEWIRNLFQRYGYSDNIGFDDEKEIYIFD